MKKEIISVFGSGPVGTFAAKELLAQGKAVRIINRSGSISEANKKVFGAEFAQDIETRSCDLGDLKSILEATAGSAAIVHAANPPDYTTWKQTLHIWQANIIEAALQYKIPVSVTENLYSYTATTMPLNEGSDEVPATTKGLLRHSIHKLLVEAEENRGLDWVSVRASDFFGPLSTVQSHLGDRYLNALYAGKTPSLIGKIDQQHSYCYVPDFGKAVAQVLLDPKTHKKVWFAPHSKPLSGIEISELFFRSFATRNGGRRPKKIAQVPGAVIKTLGLFNPLMGEIAEMLYQFEKPFYVDSSAYENHFGVQATEIKMAVEATLDWYGENSWLPQTRTTETDEWLEKLWQRIINGKVLQRGSSHLS